MQTKEERRKQIENAERELITEQILRKINMGLSFEIGKYHWNSELVFDSRTIKFVDKNNVDEILKIKDLHKYAFYGW